MKLDVVEARKQKRKPKFWRPAVFICDEYQAFATCGEDDPSGDEKAFALTRQSRCIPIVATQSISSLRATLGDGESWRALIQTLRSRIFMSLADDASLKTASELLGEVNRLKASYSLSENTGRANPSLLTGKVGGGTASAGFSKSYQQTREALFHARDLNLLGTCQAIAQIFDGRVVRDAHRVYLKPCYLDRDYPYWRLRRKPQAPRALGLIQSMPTNQTELKSEYIESIFPAITPLLNNSAVTEIMVVSRPGDLVKIFYEEKGHIEEMEGAKVTPRDVERFCMMVARPLGIDPEVQPLVDARLADGSRVAFCTPPATPYPAMTIRRFGTTQFTPADLVKLGSLPKFVLDTRSSSSSTVGRARPPAHRSARRRSQRAHCSSRSIAAWSSRGPELQSSSRRRPPEARVSRARVNLTFRAWASLAPAAPDHIVIGELRGAEVPLTLSGLNTGHGGSLTTVHANTAHDALQRVASCALQADDAPPWDNLCLSVCMAFQLVVHQSRLPDGTRGVIELLAVDGYDRAESRWLTRTLWHRDKDKSGSGSPSGATPSEAASPGPALADAEPGEAVPVDVPSSAALPLDVSAGVGSRETAPAPSPGGSYPDPAPTSERRASPAAAATVAAGVPAVAGSPVNGANPLASVPSSADDVVVPPPAAAVRRRRPLRLDASLQAPEPSLS